MFIECEEVKGFFSTPQERRRNTTGKNSWTLGAARQRDGSQEREVGEGCGRDMVLILATL